MEGPSGADIASALALINQGRVLAAATVVARVTAHPACKGNDSDSSLRRTCCKTCPTEAITSAALL